MKTLDLKYMDTILRNNKAVHSLFTFNPRTATLKLPGVLLKHRRPRPQRYFLTLQTGPAIALAMLERRFAMVSICGLPGWLDVDVCRKFWFLGVVNHKESSHPKSSSRSRMPSRNSSTRLNTKEASKVA